ncbi:hypothetical protein ACFGZ5_11830 [Pasteurella multocida]
MKIKLAGFFTLLLSSFIAMSFDIQSSYSWVFKTIIFASSILIIIDIFYIWLPRTSEKNRAIFFSIATLGTFILLVITIFYAFKSIKG